MAISLCNRTCPYWDESNASIDNWLKTTSHYDVMAPSTVSTTQNAKLPPSRNLCHSLMLCHVTRSQRNRGSVKYFGDPPELVEPSRLRRNRRSCRQSFLGASHLNSGTLIKYTVSVFDSSETHCDKILKIHRRCWPKEDCDCTIAMYIKMTWKVTDFRSSSRYWPWGILVGVSESHPAEAVALLLGGEWGLWWGPTGIHTNISVGASQTEKIWEITDS